MIPFFLRAESYLLPGDALLFSVYPGLQQLSPLVTVEEIPVELEDSFGEVVKFLDEAVLDLVSKNRAMYERKMFFFFIFCIPYVQGKALERIAG